MDELRIQIPDKMQPFLQPARHKVAHGGRGGGKSHTVAQLLLVKGVSEPIRWLCTREVQKSLKDSVHKLLSDKIVELGLDDFYAVQRDGITGANGTEFLFAGLQDHTADSIKSFEGCDGAWVEEAHKVSARSAEILVPTIRKPGSEIWWTYNPDQETDYVHQRFVIHDDPQAIVVEINWRDNPWFPEVLDIERRQLKDINEDLYQHVWEGKCRSLAGLLFKRAWFKFYDTLPANLSLYMSSDYATVEPDDENPDPDYTEHGIWGLNETGDLYAADWWYGQEDPDTWIRAGIQLIRRHKPQIWFEEKGVIRRALDASINKALRQEQVWIMREGLPSASSKAARALGFAARAAAGSVYLPRTEWAERLVNQLCAFTGQDGRHDDGVDVCSLIARGLDQMADARKPAQEHRPEVKPFTRAWLEGLNEDADKARYYR